VIDLLATEGKPGQSMQQGFRQSTWPPVHEGVTCATVQGVIHKAVLSMAHFEFGDSHLKTYLTETTISASIGRYI
jgi:hypothetical protein